MIRKPWWNTRSVPHHSTAAVGWYVNHDEILCVPRSVPHHSTAAVGWYVNHDEILCVPRSVPRHSSDAVGWYVNHAEMFCAPRGVHRHSADAVGPVGGAGHPLPPPVPPPGQQASPALAGEVHAFRPPPHGQKLHVQPRPRAGKARPSPRPFPPPTAVLWGQEVRAASPEQHRRQLSARCRSWRHRPDVTKAQRGRRDDVAGLGACLRQLLPAILFPRHPLLQRQLSLQRHRRQNLRATEYYLLLFDSGSVGLSGRPAVRVWREREWQIETDRQRQRERDRDRYWDRARDREKQRQSERQIETEIHRERWLLRVKPSKLHKMITFSVVFCFVFLFLNVFVVFVLCISYLIVLVSCRGCVDRVVGGGRTR